MKKSILLAVLVLGSTMIFQCSGNKTQDSSEAQNQEIVVLDSLSDAIEQSTKQMQKDVQQVENSLDSLLQDLE